MEATTQEMTVVPVDRRTWLRGEGAVKSCLLRPKDGKMCCMGFVAKVKGYSDEQICGMSCPCALAKIYDTLQEPLLSIVAKDKSIPFVADHAQVCSRLMLFNDNDGITDAEREEKLIAAGKEIGIRFEFFN